MISFGPILCHGIRICVRDCGCHERGFQHRVRNVEILALKCAVTISFGPILNLFTHFL